MKNPIRDIYGDDELGGHSSPIRKIDFSDNVGTGSLVYQSASMAKVVDKAHQFAPFAIPVLITGETGTGKGNLARVVHQRSQDRRRELNAAHKDQPFVVVNCGAIPANLLESILFGHKKGAFSGADIKQDKIGLFETAGAGTIFLDEIGNMPPDLQTKLLQVLEDGTFTPVGDTRTVQSHARVVSATNFDIQDMIAKEKFREDLYFRLKKVEITMPPLRDRKEDIPGLVKYFIKLSTLNNQRQDSTFRRPVISDRTIEAMQQYSWPGNIRELSGLIDMATILAQTDGRPVPIITLEMMELDPYNISRLTASVPRSKNPAAVYSGPVIRIEDIGSVGSSGFKPVVKADSRFGSKPITSSPRQPATNGKPKRTRWTQIVADRDAAPVPAESADHHPLSEPASTVGGVTSGVSAPPVEVQADGNHQSVGSIGEGNVSGQAGNLPAVDVDAVKSDRDSAEIRSADGGNDNPISQPPAVRRISISIPDAGDGVVGITSGVSAVSTPPVEVHADEDRNDFDFVRNSSMTEVQPAAMSAEDMVNLASGASTASDPTEVAGVLSSSEAIPAMGGTAFEVPDTSARKDGRPAEESRLEVAAPTGNGHPASMDAINAQRAVLRNLFVGADGQVLSVARITQLTNLTSQLNFVLGNSSKNPGQISMLSDRVRDELCGALAKLGIDKQDELLAEFQRMRVICGSRSHSPQPLRTKPAAPLEVKHVALASAASMAGVAPVLSRSPNNGHGTDGADGVNGAALQDVGASACAASPDVGSDLEPFNKILEATRNAHNISPETLAGRVNFRKFAKRPDCDVRALKDNEYVPERSVLNTLAYVLVIEGRGSYEDKKGDFEYFFTAADLTADVVSKRLSVPQEQSLGKLVADLMRESKLDDDAVEERLSAYLEPMELFPAVLASMEKGDDALTPARGHNVILGLDHKSEPLSVQAKFDLYMSLYESLNSPCRAEPSRRFAHVVPANV